MALRTGLLYSRACSRWAPVPPRTAPFSGTARGHTSEVAGGGFYGPALRPGACALPESDPAPRVSTRRGAALSTAGQVCTGFFDVFAVSPRRVPAHSLERSRPRGARLRGD